EKPTFPVLITTSEAAIGAAGLCAPTRGPAGRPSQRSTEANANKYQEDSMMKLRSKVIFTWVVTIAALLVLAKAPAIAQDATGSRGHSSRGYSGAPGAANPAAPATVDDATLERTARAYVKVQQISENERGAINGARDDASRQSIAQQAESKQVAAV